MSQYIIMCRSLTYAQRGKAMLEERGISAYLVKAPQNLSPQGCGYALSLRKHFKEALEILKNNGISRGKAYKKTESGDYEAVGI